MVNFSPSKYLITIIETMNYSNLSRIDRIIDQFRVETFHIVSFNIILNLLLDCIVIFELFVQLNLDLQFNIFLGSSV